ncbi:hypothetical protein [Oceanomicrobium pacificus]|uniref:hypothetical protein n=1 Tax=Oceanomicrobium pacificus TaxID=2692916 RepID=UPI001967529E|nr:hypothetical protein [Oceanomicrobium pacificus]
MKTLVPLAALSPSIAFAHEGAHLHPHGIDAGWALLSVALLGGVVVAVARARK